MTDFTKLTLNKIPESVSSLMTTNADLKKQNTWLTYGIIGLISIGSIYFYINYKKKSQQDKNQF